MSRITVLRLGHRAHRDHRISTHCCLVARALGADGIIYTGQKDSEMEKTVEKIAKQWGGSFTVNHAKTYKEVVKEWKAKKGYIVHLTMYGLPFHNHMNKIKKEDLLVIVGGEKVPGEVYQLADLNLAVTNQPHSEIAALGLFLDKYFSGKELDKNFSKAKLKIVPQERGKKIIKH
ncbi:MAG: tRNA (cytidine(56)-2'-O)-methyltransferase [Nanoarchaeota archaeon]